MNMGLCESHSRLRDDSGFTIVELAMSIVLFAILSALSISAMYYYLAGRALDTATRDTVSEIREAQEMAVATGNTYRVDFTDVNGKICKLQAKRGGNWVDIHNDTMPLEVTMTSHQFGTDSYLECYARGECESGYL